jgi:hypothetical protein
VLIISVCLFIYSFIHPIIYPFIQSFKRSDQFQTGKPKRIGSVVITTDKTTTQNSHVHHFSI